MSLDAVGITQGLWPERDAIDREADDVAVAEDRRAHRARDVLDLLLPAIGIRVRHRLLADHAIEHEVEQPVLGPDVPVQRARGRVQRARDVAHAEQLEAVGIEDGERRIDDGFLRERLAPRAWRTLRRPRPGWRGDLGHLNSVKLMNTLHGSGPGWY